WPEPPGNLVRYAHHIARYGSMGAGKAVLEHARNKHANDLSLQAALFKAVQQGQQEAGAELGATERQWVEELAGRLLAANDTSHVLAGIEMAQSWKITSLQEVLLGLARIRAVP